MKHTTDELKDLQSLPLDMKIRLSKARIRSWVKTYGIDYVYVAFSGGKDSTVLLDMARQDYPDMLGVFADTGLEYPELRKFVFAQDNIRIVKPKMTFRDVVYKYGYPLPSKEQAHSIEQFRNTRSEKLARARLFGKEEGTAGKISQKWIPLIYAPFAVTERCCHIMKKQPFQQLHKKEGMVPLTAQMTVESRSRKKIWLQHGCNMYDIKLPKSNPISFWTEQDVLQYVYENKLPIAQIYGEVICEDGVYRTTGESRTGCMFCMYGITAEESPNRFQRMAETHPAQYDYCINGGKHQDGLWRPDRKGLGLGKVLDYIGIPYKEE